MKSFVLSALACAALAQAVGQCAGSNDLTLTAPTEAVPGGSRSYFTITSPTPGFLTMTLDDASGTGVALLFDMEEIHTNEKPARFLPSEGRSPAGSGRRSTNSSPSGGVSGSSLRRPADYSAG